MKATSIGALILVLASSLGVPAQTDPPAPDKKGTFDRAAATIERQLKESTAELEKLRKQIAEEKIPLSRTLSKLEAELSEVRGKHQQTSRLLDSRTLDLTNLRN
jgi:hypothetical protein